MGEARKREAAGTVCGQATRDPVGGCATLCGGENKFRLVLGALDIQDRLPGSLWVSGVWSS